MTQPLEPIAIVGLGGLFPGGQDLRAFWDAIRGCRDAAREVPEGRWPVPPASLLAREPGAVDAVLGTRACLLERIPDATAGLAVDAGLVARLDPLFALVLHAGRQAFEDARLATVDRSRVGVAVANIVLPTDHTSALSRAVLGPAVSGQGGGRSGAEPLDRHAAGLPGGLLATALGLGGGATTLDAACASSLYALWLASMELQAGRVDAVLAGGASRPCCLYTQMGFSQLRALSKTGVCRPFDARADGLVVGEGAGVFVLRRLRDAVAAGEHVYGVLRGIGLSNDRGGSLLAPDREGQLRAMREAYRAAGWEPSSVDLVECHGTGTPTGDAVEFASLRELWGSARAPRGRCPIGSVKSNVGHLLTGAGAAGLMKVLLAVRERTLPPQANFERADPRLGYDESPFEVLGAPRSWERRAPGVPRRAAVSAFGFGGINAHVLLEEWCPTEVGAQSRWLEEAGAPARGGGAGRAPRAVPPAVAIVGVGARVGTLSSARALQEASLTGRGALGSRPAGRWQGLERSAWFAAEGLTALPSLGAWCPGLEVEVGEWRISPREFEEMLPQQVLALLAVRDALRSARPDTAPERTGVFAGIGLDLGATSYFARWTVAEGLRAAVCPPLTANRVTGNLGGIVASRVAREFGAGGPSFTLSAEENSGLRALAAALRALQEGRIDRALVLAVDLPGDVRNLWAVGSRRAWSRSGRVVPFDRGADGSLPGEGAVALVLRREEDAQRDGERTFCRVLGLGQASGGSDRDLTPTVETYGAALRRAYEDAGVEPASVGYLEAHGSGAPDEDALEARALTRFFGQGRSPGTPRCSLGSVKAAVGHLGSAAGLAGVAHAALCLYQELLPPVPGFTEPRAELRDAVDLFHVPREARPWLRDRCDGPRRAGVSGMSADGTCVHVVLQEAAPPTGPAADVAVVERRAPLGALPVGLFVVGADSTDGLGRSLRELVQFVAAQEGPISAVARRWYEARGVSGASRLAAALVARDGGDLEALAGLARGQLDGASSAAPSPGRERVFVTATPLGRDGQLAFVFPGAGNHALGSGLGVATRWPELLRSLDAHNELLATQFSPELYEPRRLSWPPGWEREAEARLLARHNELTFGHVAHAALVADLFRSFGVTPQAALGYSLGESAQYFALGAWTARDEMVRRMRASTLFTEDLVGPCSSARKAWGLEPGATVDWGLGLVDRAAPAVREALDGLARVYLLIVNAPDECVVGGARDQVARLVARLGCSFVALEGVSTVHCEAARPVAEAYRELHLLPATPPSGVRFYSHALGRAHAVTRESAADSILAQAVGCIDFTDVVRSAWDDGVRIFLETGPRASCSRMVGKILGSRPHVALSLGAPGADAPSAVLRVLGRLIAERVPVSLESLYGLPSGSAEREPGASAAGPGRRIQLPVVHPLGSVARPAAPPAAPPPPPPPPPSREPSPPLALAPAPAPAPAPASQPPLLAGIMASLRATASAHEAFLRASAGSAEVRRRAIELQLALVAAGGRAGEEKAGEREEREERAPSAPVVFTREQCMEFALGKLGNVLGPGFAVVDEYPTRVRLPNEPLMFVDRITAVEGTPGGLGAGRLVTEHDVLPGAWYLDHDRIPTGVSVEAGQADLFLSGYLGIDLKTRGLAMYRLLDAVVTFHGPLPRPTSTISYDIRIDRFIRQADTYLFFFSFDGTVAGQPFITMREGCAGFFTPRQLTEGRGLVLTEEDTAPTPGRRPEDWRPMAPLGGTEAYGDEALDALRRADLAAAFGPAFAGLGVPEPLALPSGLLDLVDRVTALEPDGGRFGLGRIRAEKDIPPDAWFLVNHFIDDQVMPGTLMYESCMQALRVFLLRLGWVVPRHGAAFEPIPGVQSRLRCRGQVVPGTRQAQYDISIKELGYGPEPYCLADAVMYADGRAIVQCLNMAVRLTGATREDVERPWRDRAPASVPTTAVAYGPDRILAYAVGDPSFAFGEAYRCFDRERFLARLPGPPYLFVDRITAVEGTPFELRAGGVVEGEYDVPPEAWYFRADRGRSIPFSVLLEFPLQICGWYAAYLGSALTSDTALHFRNLDGKATLHQDLGRDAGTLHGRIRLTSVSSSGGMIIQKYDFAVTRRGEPVYDGSTVFGFFSEAALAQQVGVRGARPYEPTPAELGRALPVELADLPPATPEDLAEAPAEGLALPGRAYRMHDAVDCFVPEGGPHGLGYIRGTKRVEPAEWFFKAHFYQDPVIPGSLGLEAFIQLLKVVARHRWGAGRLATHRFEPIAVGREHAWSYRGQVIPANRAVSVSAVVEAVDDAGLLLEASGYLSVDGRVIYQMNRFALRMVPIEGRP